VTAHGFIAGKVVQPPPASLPANVSMHISAARAAGDHPPQQSAAGLARREHGSHHRLRSTNLTLRRRQRQLAAQITGQHYIRSTAAATKNGDPAEVEPLRGLDSIGLAGALTRLLVLGRATRMGSPTTNTSMPRESDSHASGHKAPHRPATAVRQRTAATAVVETGCSRS
jgi:hypothetical protein